MTRFENGLAENGLDDHGPERCVERRHTACPDDAARSRAERIGIPISIVPLHTVIDLAQYFCGFERRAQIGCTSPLAMGPGNEPNPKGSCGARGLK